MTTMQRRHFEFIAETIRTSTDLMDSERRIIAADFARRLRSTNQNFDAGRFMDACQPATTYKNRSR